MRKRELEKRAGEREQKTEIKRERNGIAVTGYFFYIDDPFNFPFGK